MRGDWKGPFNRRLQKARSERGRRLASIRWAKDRDQRDRLAMLTAEQFPSRIVRRIVVIDNERVVREVTIWNWESGREGRRKERAVLKWEGLTVGSAGGKVAVPIGNRLEI